ncbi:LacI family DNA-binding transcriptional regulator [Labilibacter marinus]|uniref:LacI family DNA-binding transcriptional regulator n=1 Tax=Labilibacter marinus TaxID=1477105 RepID=UPI00082A2661|nr:LacI family DNA-binding transcriptional regulator [Labilibacter marinus]
MKRITINDIAKELNVTPSTVSRALAGNTRVSVKTRELVTQKAKELGYQQNVIAASLRKGKSDTIGMIVPRINRHFFSNVISGVEEILNPAGYTLVIVQSGENLIKEKKAIDMLLANHVGGIILSLSVQTNTYQHIETVINRGIPLVQFDRVNLDIKSSKVLNDNFTGAYLATKHLIKSGYQRIAHLGGARSLKAYDERFKGYSKAIEESGRLIEDALVYENAITREAGYKAINQVMERANPDAVFCAGDYSALGVLDALKEKNLKIPEEFGVVGFANEPFSELIHPTLSTVEQNAFEMGTRVATAMIKNLEGKHYEEEEVIPTRLIVRDSSWKK